MLYPWTGNHLWTLALPILFVIQSFRTCLVSFSTSDIHANSVVFENPWIFMHIPKTAGTSFAELLRRLRTDHFNEQCVDALQLFEADNDCEAWINGISGAAIGEPYRMVKSSEHPERWQGIPEYFFSAASGIGTINTSLTRIRCLLLTHFDYSVVQSMRGSHADMHFRTFTFVRHPLALFHSLFFWFKYELGWYHFTKVYLEGETRHCSDDCSVINISRTPTEFEGLVMDMNRSTFAELAHAPEGCRFLRPPPGYACSVWEKQSLVATISLVAQFAGDSPMYCRGTRRPMLQGKARFDLALKNAKEFDYIGFVEDVPSSMLLLQAALGLPKVPELPRKNTIKVDRDLQGDSSSEVDAQLLKRTPLREDAILYENVWSLFQQRVAKLRQA